MMATRNPALHRPHLAWLQALLVALCLLPPLAQAASTINLSFSPPTVNPGDASSISISVYNSGLNALTSTAITINLASGVTLSAAPTVSDSCGFTGIGAPANGSQLVLTGGTVPAAVPSGADGSCTFSVPVVSVSAGNHTTTVPANGPANGFVAGGSVSGFSAVDNGSLVSNGTAASATLAISTLSNPSGAMTVSPSTVYVGETTTLTATLTNNNASVTLPLSSFAPTLPAGMVLAASPAGSVSCTGTGAVNGTLSSPSSPGTLTAGDSSFTLNGGTIGAGGACTVQLNLQVPASAGSVSLAAATNAIGNARGLGSAAFTRSVTVSNPVSVSQTATPSTTVRAGQPVSLRVTIANASASTPLSILSFTDNLASGLVVDAAIAPAISCTGTGAVNGSVTATPGAGSFTLSNATAGKGGNCQVTVGVALNAAGTLASTSATTVVAGTQITNSAVAPANLTVPSSSLGITAASAFTVAKSVSSANAYPGQALSYTVTLSNWSAGAASNVSFTDNLPSVGGVPMLLAAGSALGTGCSGGSFTATAGTSSVTWTGGTVVGGSGTSAGTCTISIAAAMPDTATVGSAYTNTLPAGTAVTATNLSSGSIANTNAASAVTNTTASVSLAQTLSGGTIVQGGSSTLRVTFTNPTPDALTNTAFTETLNPNVTIAATPAITSSSCAGTPVFAAVAGSGSFSVSGLTIPANSSTCRISVNVSSTAISSGSGWATTIPAGAISNDLGQSNSAAASVSLKVTTALTASAAFSPSAVGLNGNSRLTLTLNNVSTMALSNVAVNHPLQTGSNAFVVAALPNVSTTCAGSPTLTASAGASTMAMSGASLAAGASCTLAFDVRMSAGTGWTDTLPIGSITSSEGASNTSAVTASASNALAVAAAFSPTSAGLNGNSRLTVTLSNSGAVSFTGAAFSSSMQAGGNAFVLAAAPAASTTCAGNPVITAVGGATSIAISGVTLAAGTNCALSFDVRTTAGGPWTYTLPAGAVTTAEGASSPSSATASLSKVTGSLGVNKSFSPISIVGGSPSTLQIDITNSAGSGSAANAVALTDTFPAGMEVHVVPGASTTCTNGAVSAGAASITLTGADIAVGATCSVFVNVTSVKPLNLTNTIDIGALASRQGYTNSVATSASLSTLQGVGAEKSFSPMAVSPGQVSRLTVKLISTLSTVSLSNVSVTDTLPAGVVVAPSSNLSSTCATAPSAAAGGGSVAISGVALAPQTNCSFALDVMAASIGSYTNTIPIGGVTSAEGYASQSAAAATLTVMAAPTVGLAYGTPTIASGGSTTLTLTLSNNSNQTLTGLALSQSLPPGLSVALTPAAATTCSGGSVSATAAGASIALSGASLAAGTSCTFRASVTSNTAATYTAAVASSAVSTLQGITNTAGASAALVVLQFPTLAQSLSASSISAGGTSDLTVTLGNANASSITLASALSVSLPTSPGAVLVNSPNGLGNSCPGTPTASPASGAFSYPVGAAIPPGGCSFTLRLIASTPGSYAQTIAAGALQTSAGNSQSASTVLLTVTSAVPPTANSFSASVNDDVLTPQTLGPLSGSATAPATLGAYTLRSLPNSALGALYCNGALVASVPLNCAAAQLAFLPVAAAVGSTAFTYTVSDSNAAVSAAATVTVTVNGPPSANAINLALNNDATTALAIGPLSGTALGGATLASYRITALPGAKLGVYCNAVLLSAVPAVCAAGQVTVLPVAAPGGTASFSYSVTDSNGMVSPAAAVTVSFNTPPTANAVSNAGINSDAATAQALAAMSGTATTAGATLASYTVTTLPAAGTLYCSAAAIATVPSRCAANALSYRPAGTAVNPVIFSYTVSDSNAMVSAAAVFSIPLNLAPSANAINLALNNDATTAVAIGPLSGTALGGATLASYRITALPGAKLGVYCNAVLLSAVPAVCAAGQVTVLPVAAPGGTASFSYSVTDSNGMVSPAAAVTVSFNTPPTANAVSNAGINSDAATAQALAAMSGTATTAGATLASYTVTTLPAAGTLYCSAVAIAAVPSRCAANALSYRPAGTAVNPVIFSYTVSDSNAMVSAAAVFSIPLNLAPSANAIDAALNNNLGTPTAIGPLQGRASGTATLVSFRIETLPDLRLKVYCGGALLSAVPAVCAANQVTVLPVAAPSGTATFSYTVTDSLGMTSPAAAVSLRFNTPPLAQAVTNAAINGDAATAQALSPMSGTVTTAGATLTGYRITSLPSAGTLSCNGTAVAAAPSPCASAVLGYRPAASVAVDGVSFGYAVTDSNGLESAPALFSIPLNTAPAARDFSNAVNNDAVSPVAIGPFGDAAAVAVSSTVTVAPANALLFCNGTRARAVPADCAPTGWSVLPQGSPTTGSTLSYRVTDPQGMNSAAATGTIRWNTPPRAADLSTRLRSTPTAQALPALVGTVTTAGATLGSYRITALPPAAQAILLCQGSALAAVPAVCPPAALTLQPAAGAGSATRFSYTVTDSNGQTSAAAWVSLTLGTPPLAQDLGLNDGRGSAALVLAAMSGTASTPGASITTYTVTSLPAAGTLTCSGVALITVPTVCAPAQLAFQAAAGAGGRASFTYTVTDSDGLVSAPATVSILVQTPPLARALAAGPLDNGRNTPQALPPLAGTATTEGATIVRYTVSTLPAAAAGTLWCDGLRLDAAPADCAADRLAWVVSPGATGSASFAYTVTDSHGQVSEPASVSVALSGSPALTLAKRSGGVFTVGFDATYTLQVSNRSAYTGTRAPISVVDTLPAGLDFLSAGAAGGASDWSCSYAAASRQLSCVSSATVAPGADAQAIVLKVRPNASALGSATDHATLVNTATVSGGGEAVDYADGSAPGAQPHAASDTQTVQNAATVSGSVWLDLNANGMKDPGEPLLDAGSVRVEAWPAGTSAEQAQGGTPMASVLIDGSGHYAMAVLPGDVQIRFVNVASGGGMGAPVNGETPGTRDQPQATGGAGVIRQGVIDHLQVKPGAVITEQSLPIDPQGFVYDSGTRQPVGGAAVTLMAQGTAVPPACLTGGPNPYVTAASGAFAGGYQFLLDFGAGGCAGLSGATFTLQVAAAGYRSPSSLIPAGEAGQTVFTPPPGVGAVAIVPQATVPGATDPTTHYLAFVLSSATKGVVNNHLPVDGSSRPGLAVTKTASKAAAEIGDLVRYTVSVRNAGTAVLPALSLVDQLPLGFKLVEKTAMLSAGGTTAALAPAAAAPVLRFGLPGMAPGAVASLQYLVRIGVGGDRGDGVNRVHVSAGPSVAADASAQVAVSAGVFGGDACVAGKVFLDCNGNGVQDEGEPGVPGVRLWLETGVSITADGDGKFSLCGLSPRTHSLKLDRVTLPEGAVPQLSSQRNLGDPGSLLLDAKHGELLRADFALGRCTPSLLQRLRAGALAPPRGGAPGIVFESPAPADRSAP